MTITQFLEGRLLWLGAMAGAASRDGAAPWAKDQLGHLLDDQGRGPVADFGSRLNALEHVLWNDPQRVHADIEAKTAILDEHREVYGECAACSGEHHADPTLHPCRTLKLLAAVWSDHPDYDRAWRV